MASDVSETIAAYLQTDVLVSSASSVRALNPGKWAADADVPAYMFQPLYTIWTPPSSSLSDFRTRITGSSGQRTTKAFGYIEVVPLMYDNAFNPETMIDDETGSESAIVDILFSIPRPVPTAQFDQLKMAELRVRLLLDYNWRTKAGKTPLIPVATSSTIDSSNYFFCFFQQFLNDPNASEVVVRYKVNYVRQTGLTNNIP